MLTAALALMAGGWQFTTWGMTEAEVRAASPVGVGPHRSPGLDRDDSMVRLVSQSTAGGFAKSVAFRFSREGKLNGVVLTPSNQRDCPRMMRDMRDVLGKPERESISGRNVDLRWRSDATGSIVAFNMVMDGPVPFFCLLEYTPIPVSVGY